MVAQSQARPERRGHCPKVRAAIAHNRVSTWKAQDALGQRRTRVSKAPVQGCGYAAWVRDLWAARARRTTRRARWLVLPATRDWETAVRVTQRVYPGTARWLLSCSGGEGGHGGFVYNRQGSGAAGWLQFLPDTFYGHVDAALADVRRRGFRHRDVRSIFHPLGQALTGAYMRTHGQSGHWDPAVDWRCA